MFENVIPNSNRWFNPKPLLNELWEEISNYNHLYYVSNYGRILRLKHIRMSKRYYKKGKAYPTKIFRVSKNKQGYVNTQINFGGYFKTFKVHRLVAETFIPNPENKPQVNHRDGNKLNNRVDNLEWCTNGENGKHAWENGLRTKRIGNNNKFSVKVNQYDLDGTLIKKWNCINDISRELGIAHSLITSCCQNKQKTSHNYIWKYAMEEENGMEV